MKFYKYACDHCGEEGAASEDESAPPEWLVVTRGAPLRRPETWHFCTTSCASDYFTLEAEARRQLVEERAGR